jgi:hypothetical protein
MPEVITSMTTGAPAPKVAPPAATPAPADPNPAGNGAAPAAPIVSRETLPNEGKPANAEDQKLATRFASLAKKEADLRRQQDDLKKREDALKGTPTLESLRKRAEANPIEVMQELGWTYEKMTKFLLNDNKHTPEHIRDELAAKIDGLEKKLTAKEEKEQSDYRSKVEETFKSDIANHIEKSTDLDFLKTYPHAREIVYYHMDNEFRTKQNMMKIDEAVAVVEKQLYSQAESFLKTPKGKALAEQILGTTKQPEKPNEGKTVLEIKPVST